jgi:hypothetical protein
MNLIGTELISEFIDTVIFTGFLNDSAPQSAMIIAAPESGKTSIVTDKNARSVIVCSDMIGSGLVQELAQKPEIRHIVINDMVAIMAHKQVTNQRTWAVMMALMEEGLGKSMMPGDLSTNLGGKKAGFICCIPASMVQDQRRWWNQSGFTSRTIPFNYQYSDELELKIKKDIIVTGVYQQKTKKVVLNVPIKNTSVEIPEKEARIVQRIANEIAEDNGEKGLRKGKQMRALVTAHALLNDRKIVDTSDLQFLRNIQPFINYEIATSLQVAPNGHHPTPQKRKKR